MLNDTHIQLTREMALQSPCVRRKYGALITDGIDTVVTNNQRVSKCCNHGCVRDIAGLVHGENTGMGAEVHAEQAALIRWKKDIDKNTKILVQGYAKRSHTAALANSQIYPCHACAMMLKFAGFRTVWITDEIKKLYAVELTEILEFWEKQWENPL